MNIRNHRVLTEADFSCSNLAKIFNRSRIVLTLDRTVCIWLVTSTNAPVDSDT